MGSRSSAATNPYGSTVATPLSRKQIYFDGISYNSGIVNLVDYAGNSATSIYTGSTGSASSAGWAESYPHASIAARLGSGGKQVIVSVVFMPAATVTGAGDIKGEVELFVWDGKAQTMHKPNFTATKGQNFDLYFCAFGGSQSNHQLNSEISAAAGDLTGDGRDEIGFCVGNRFVILDSGLSTILYDDFASPSSSIDNSTISLHPSRVAAGDIKGDGRTEFIVTYGSTSSPTYTGSYKVFGGSSPTLIDSGSLGTGNACPLNLMYANVALGDIDGDGRKEVLFSGREDANTNGCGLAAAAWDNGASKLKFLSAKYEIPVVETDWAYNPVPPLVAFNPDGRDSVARDIVLAWDNVVEYGSSTSPKAFSQGYKGLVKIDRPVDTNLAAADVNYDCQDELVSLSSAGGVGFVVYSLGTGGAFRQTTIPVAPGDLKNFRSLCVADLTGKSLVLRYLSQTVKYSNPSIVAVLASPPYYADAAGNSAMGNTGTTFGSKTETTDAYSTSFTVSASYTFGAEVECPLEGDALKVRNTATLGASFSYAFESEKTMSCSHSYTTMTGNDAVIFSCVPFDVYTYEILSAPNSGATGKTMTVDFPRAPQLVMMDRDIFNAIPSNALQVGANVLCHTLGVPSSYRNHDQVVALCKSVGDMYDDGGVGVPVGASAYDTSTVCYTKSKGSRVGAGVSVTQSAEAVILGVVFGESLGFDTSFEYTVKTAESTEISGSAPGINITDSPFLFGIAGYKVADASVQPNPFLVVTYWVGK